MYTENLSVAKRTIVGVQFLFVAFGATVLVPLLIGINPATALFTAGLGTFLFHIITKGKVPIFLGSSFAFIAPIMAATKQWGLPGTLAGLTSVSLVYFAMSALVKWQGRKLLDRIFPPVVVGPVIILIGLSLSGSAVNMANEHIGDVYAVGAVAQKDFVKEPGLHRTMLGDGVACLTSAVLGGPPETTYSEVTGAMSITKITSPAVIRVSAATAICFSIVGKLSALLQSIPQAVLGGIMLLLFGTIASVGVQNLIQRKVNMSDTRNVIIVSIMLTMGLGGAVLSSGNFAVSGIGLSAIIGVILNLILPKGKSEEHVEAAK